MPSLFEHAGGEPALHHLEETFYASVLADPLLQPLFGDGQPHHVDHLTAFTAESFGGPDRFTRELGGFEHLIDVHRGLHMTEKQRLRFVELYLAALDAAGMPDDEPFREAVPGGAGRGGEGGGGAVPRGGAVTRRVRDPGREAELARDGGRRAASAARGPAMDLGRR